MVCDINDKQCKKHFPKLKVKAAECQACLPAFLHVWERSMDGDQRSHVWIKLALQAATQMDQILKDYPECMALPREAAASLWKMAKQYHVCTVALERQFWSEESRCLFQSGTFKGHWLLHGVAMAGSINPRRSWCYSGESFMSDCKVLMQSCLKGRGILASMCMFVERFNLAIAMDLKQGFRLK
jgi:hypothetical protein